VSSWSKVPLLSIWSVAVPLCRPLLPCPSRWHGSLPRHGLWWLTCELHCSPLPWRLGSVYQLWKSPLLSCVPWFINRFSYWYFTWSALFFYSWTTSLELVTTRAASMQYNFVLQVKSQDTLLPPPRGQLELSGRASDCVLWRSMRGLNKFW